MYANYQGRMWFPNLWYSYGSSISQTPGSGTGCLPVLVFVPWSRLRSGTAVRIRCKLFSYFYIFTSIILRSILYPKSQIPNRRQKYKILDTLVRWRVIFPVSVLIVRKIKMLNFVNRLSGWCSAPVPPHCGCALYGATCAVAPPAHPGPLNELFSSLCPILNYSYSLFQITVH